MQRGPKHKFAAHIMRGLQLSNNSNVDHRAAETIGDNLEEFQYTTNHENNILLMRAMHEILYVDLMRPLMRALARELVELGVDFSNANPLL